MIKRILVMCISTMMFLVSFVSVYAATSPLIQTQSVSNGKVGVEYSQTITASGDPTPSFSVSKGSLPADLLLSEDGQITGTPTKAGTYQFTVRADNLEGGFGKDYELVVEPKIEIRYWYGEIGGESAAPNLEKWAAGGTRVSITSPKVAGWKPGRDKVDWTAPSGNLSEEDSVTVVDVVYERATYTIKILNDGHGTASASLDKAEMDTDVSLTAEPNKGYHFKEWKIISGKVKIKGDSFSMPGSDVTLKAVFEADESDVADVSEDSNNNSPSTGDSNQLLLWVVLMAASILGIARAARLERFKK